jgi:polar amino acid transport system substrate-binding protein
MSLTRQARAASLLPKHSSLRFSLPERLSMHLKRTLALTAALALTLPVAACGSSSGSSSNKSSGGNFGDCKVTSKKNSISIKPAQSGTLTVETTLPAQGWWNGTTPSSIKSGYEYCMAANLANMAGLTSVTVKNVSFDQLVAGRTNSFDMALAEISITPERAKVVDFSTPYFDSNIGVLIKKGADVTQNNINSKKCAAYSGTTSVPFIENKLKCNAKIYPDSQTLYQGVLSGQVDADFLDTAIVLAEAKSTGGKLEVVGQYNTGEKYGAIYPKNSPNEKALDKGIQTLISDGTTKQLSKDYLGPAFGGDPSSVPVWTIQ